MKTLHIQNYKCFKNLEISGLRQVNLFTGKNNTGKSSILEAISLMINKANIRWINKLLEKRQEISRYKNEHLNKNNPNILSSFFYNRNISFSEKDNILINSDDNKLSLQFVRIVEDKVIEEGKTIIIQRNILDDNDIVENDFSYGFRVEFNQNSKVYNLDRNLFRNVLFSRMEEQNNIHLIDAKGKSFSDNAILWDNITLSDKEEYIIQALKIIETKISRLSFIADNGNSRIRYPIVKLKDFKELYPLNAMGNGINRILSIILALVNSDNGYLLIDEFENGLHYSVQAKVWQIIFELAKTLNVQVFATTHSNDSVWAFAKTLENNKNFEGSLYRMEKTEDAIKAYSFSKEEVLIAYQQNINLR